MNGISLTANPASVSDPVWIPQDLRVPRDDRTVFAKPDLSVASSRADANRELLDLASVSLQGRTIQQLREWSRQEVLKLACTYTEKMTGQTAGNVDPAAVLFATGHQPELYHPGVWIKNFAVSAWARQSKGVGLNLVIDNDTLSKRHVSVPIGDRLRPEVTQIPFDLDASSCPWEEVTLSDAAEFNRFPDRVGDAMRAWDVDSLVHRFWPAGQVESGAKLRDVFTASRMQLERSWNSGNLEVPLSSVCETDPFLWFAGWVLAQPERFREIHNQALHEFRVVNKVRSGSRPVPDLVRQDEWTESPFWIWREGDSQRARLFARQTGRETILSDGRNEIARFPLDASMDACCAVETLRELPRRGIRLRTRALTTTLFARLCLSDLFVHGIGGAKYDEVTDRLITRLLGIPAPKFMTLSCTLHLPLGQPFDVTSSELTRLRERQRDLQWNPERSLSRADDPEIARLIDRKEQLIQEHHQRTTGTSVDRVRVRRENRHRHQELRSVSEQLSRWTSSQQSQLSAEIERTEQELAANKVLKNREFSFVLYPEKTISEFLSNAVQPTAPAK